MRPPTAPSMPRPAPVASRRPLAYASGSSQISPPAQFSHNGGAPRALQQSVPELLEATTPLRRQRSLTKQTPDARHLPQHRAPIMRKAGQPLPLARTGATTYRGGIGVSSMDHTLSAYTKPPPTPYFEERTWWVFVSWLATCLVLPCCLRFIGKDDPIVQQAWREKVTLCIIIGLIMMAVAFLSFGLQAALCPESTSMSSSNAVLSQGDHANVQYRDDVIAFGYIYDFNDVGARLSGRGNIALTSDWHGSDITALFEPDFDQCKMFFPGRAYRCSVPNKFPGSPPLAPGYGQPCPTNSWLLGLYPKGRAYFTWQDVYGNISPPHTLMVFNGMVMNLTNYLADASLRFTDNLPISSLILSRSIGTDGTMAFSGSYESLNAVHCLTQSYVVGYMDNDTPGCAATHAIQSICLAVILCVVGTRFIMAITFHWFISPRITRLRSVDRFPPPPGFLNGARGRLQIDNGRPRAKANDPFVILLVTCYSEGDEGIRNTMESLASTDFPDTNKLLFIICDGLITGSGNSMSTPDAVVSMIDVQAGLENPQPKSYLAIAHGAKQHNMAKVYAGHYRHQCGGQVPVIVVVKCGTPAERDDDQKRAGNRGKRDSQLILMNFISRVMFNDRMTPLDYDICLKIVAVAGVTPDLYTLVLMVDADTIVAQNSLSHMVQAMKNDPRIMGLCGETRIANKRTNWVTAIQVFEYYISHHLGKAFESVFGGVTCLPGCFSMYRIKSPKGPHGAWVVPILANPDIVDEYSENVVDTLHKKNLLLLGEDRFLTTLLLRTFPKRKMVFVPQAICRTVVPDTFKMLLSQRRRWINSTIHNLLELVLLRDLCGIFCFSMQFIVLLELIGTVVLPAALLFVFVLLFSAMITGHMSTIPLFMLLATLGLPGVLIVITTRKLVYLLWMFVYIAAMPIWNFVLPLYAFWRFDDFTWGETRKIEGEKKQSDHSQKHGEYQVGSMTLKSWVDWEAERRGIVRKRTDDRKNLTVSQPVEIQEVETVEEVALAMMNELEPPRQPHVRSQVGNLSRTSIAQLQARRREQQLVTKSRSSNSVFNGDIHSHQTASQALSADICDQDQTNADISQTQTMSPLALQPAIIDSQANAAPVFGSASSFSNDKKSDGPSTHIALDGSEEQQFSSWKKSFSSIMGSSRGLVEDFGGSLSTILGALGSFTGNTSVIETDVEDNNIAQIHRQSSSPPLPPPPVQKRPSVDEKPLMAQSQSKMRPTERLQVLPMKHSGTLERPNQQHFQKSSLPPLKSSTKAEGVVSLQQQPKTTVSMDEISLSPVLPIPESKAITRETKCGTVAHLDYMSGLDSSDTDLNVDWEVDSELGNQLGQDVVPAPPEKLYTTSTPTWQTASSNETDVSFLIIEEESSSSATSSISLPRRRDSRADFSRPEEHHSYSHLELQDSLEVSSIHVAAGPSEFDITWDIASSLGSSAVSSAVPSAYSSRQSSWSKATGTNIKMFMERASSEITALPFRRKNFGPRPKPF